MGSSFSCPCASESEESRGSHVLVIKQNGTVIKVKEGTHVKEILASNPHHMILRCRSDQSLLLLPDSVELRSNGLYFLVAEEGHDQQALGKDTFHSLMKLARSRAKSKSTHGHHHKNNIMPSACKTKTSTKKYDHDHDQDMGPHFNFDQILVLNASDFDYNNKSSSWGPALHTIPELRSLEDLKG